MFKLEGGGLEMTEHYYSSKPAAEHARSYIEETLRGKNFRFVTDAGVFSKGGIDFGSKLLIESVDIPTDARVLDVGCGYGPIGLSAAFLAMEGFVTMIDVNERAVGLARENAELNGITNVEILQSDLFQELGGRRFSRILTNPPIRAGKDVVFSIFEQGFEHLDENGELWIVIQKKQGSPSAFEKLQTLFSDVQEVTKDKGYRIFRARRARTELTHNFENP
jgi:16S rRNA (guanine1207-N2)-methyltransferase